MRWKISASVDGELSGGLSVCRPGSEDPIGASGNWQVFFEVFSVFSMFFNIFQHLSIFSTFLKCFQVLSSVFQCFSSVFKCFQVFSSVFQCVRGVSRYFRNFVCRPESEDPHRRQRNFFPSHHCNLLSLLATEKVESSSTLICNQGCGNMGTVGTRFLDKLVFG